MDESKKAERPNPSLDANYISLGTFWWLNPLFKKGYNRPLEHDDLFDVCPSDSSSHLGNQLEKEWQKQLEGRKHGKQPSLFKALFNTFGIQYILMGGVVFFEEATRVVQPLLLGGLIQYFVPNSDVSRTKAWLYAMGVSMCAVLLAVSHHPYFFWVQRIGMRMRVACCSLMYKKSLKLSNKAMGETTTGQIVNLMSNDVNRFDQAVIFLHFLWVGPLQAAAVLIILWHELGPSVLAGFFVLTLLIPLQGFMGKLFSKLRHKTAIHTDERVKVMNEIIAGMRVIKMYCWERPFGHLVEKIRQHEIRNVHRTRRAQAIVLVPFFASAKTILLATFFALLTWTDQAMTSYRVFLTIGIFQAVRVGLTLFIPFSISHIAELKVVFRRVEKFLLLEEVDKPTLTKNSLRPKLEDCSVVIKDVTGKWDEEVEQNTLDNVNLEVKPGELIAVIGPVGCGKSSLLMAVLGELPIHKGEVRVKGKVAYVSQQSWIFSGSIRQNILFGAEFDPVKYNQVIYVAALKRDFEIMPDGDATLIGDRGVSLSGGQKARVSLARALYMDADIYLMDDPLSAVDAAVARHIFERCILKYLKNKLRILVTHQIQFLPDANKIFILNEGKVSSEGSFSELSQSGVDFAELLKEDEEEEESPASPTSLQKTISLTQVDKYGSMMSLCSMVEEYQPEPVTLPEEEERASGTVGFGVYIEYFKAGTGLVKFLLLILVNLLAQFFYVGSDWWLSQWANKEEDRHAAKQEYFDYLKNNNISTFQAANASINITIPYVDSNRNISIFAAIIAAVVVFGLIRALLFFKVCVDASQTLHNRMFARILRCPVLFFDTNPVGRVLNRFSKDVGHIDDLLPVCFFDFVQCSLLIIGIVMVAGIINPYVFIPTVPLVILFIIIRMYYLRTSRSIKRLEGTLRSPVFSYLSASLQGLATIRSMDMESICVREFDKFQDGHSEAWFLFLATSRWLALRLDWLCVFFVTAVTFCAVLVSDSMNAGLVGLSITYAMTLMGMFQWGVRQSAEVENQMISVERVLEYSNLPEEAELDSDSTKKPPPSWPIEGAIVAQHLFLQYSANGPQVLKDLSFSIRGKEKVGIVGRTGAGKSSLITALFRMAEPEGMVMIDGVNIQNIGLHDLRRNISIIPQDPFLFTGPLRKNLDPFGEHSDESLWRALDEVKLKEQIKDLPQELATEVSEGGSNFSVGQRQLICLARAVLRNNRILLIDEATANVDPITDELIQATIRTKFRECTVLTIAHRLHTIMDSDRVLVLDNGSIMEFDTPYTLLSQGNGYFYDMAQQTGKAEFERLLEISREADSKSKPIVEAKSNGKAAFNNVKVDHQGDSTLRDISGSLNDTISSEDGSPKQMTYDLDDIEDSLNAVPEDEIRDYLQEKEAEGTGVDEQQALQEEEEDKVIEDIEKLTDAVEVDEDSSRTLVDSVKVQEDGERVALLSPDVTVSGVPGQSKNETEVEENNEGDSNDADDERSQLLTTKEHSNTSLA